MHAGMASHRSFVFGDVCAKTEIEKKITIKNKVLIKEKIKKKRNYFVKIITGVH